MPDAPILNAWGEPIDPTKPSPVYLVPEEERLDVDGGPGSDALGEDDHEDDTGDDLEGWQPGDPIADPLGSPE